MKRSKLLFARDNKKLMVAVLAGMMVSLTVGGVASALEYTSNPVPVSFTFNSVLTLSTDGNIAISNLTPGNKGISSNDYTVTVSTNSVAGYTLSATVGCASGTGCFNSKILGDGNNNDFAMVETTTTLTPGKWGVSLDSTATENSNFKTLPLYSDTAETINQTTDASGTAASGYQGTQDTTFRVGAYASESQVAGTYTNVINFTAVANMVANCGNYTAEYCMQSASTWKGSLTTGQQVQAMDARDGKLYYVAKLADGNVWMTQNLDHDIVAQANYYTPQNTDIPSAWTPVRATYPTATTGTSAWCVGGTWNSQDGDCESNYTPESYDPGNLYWNGTESDYSDWDDYWIGCDFTTNTPVCNETLNPIATYTTNDGTPIVQYHIGNFYNWNAAVAMNDTSSLTTSGQIVDQSICPAGWTLPRVGTGNDSFYALWNTYGFGSSSINGGDKLWQSPLYVVASGYWNGYLDGVGYNGSFWSPVIYNSYYSYEPYFSVVGTVEPSEWLRREIGTSVRCILRPVASTVSGL